MHARLPDSVNKRVAVPHNNIEFTVFRHLIVRWLLFCVTSDLHTVPIIIIMGVYRQQTSCCMVLDRDQTVSVIVVPGTATVRCRRHR